MGQRDIALQSAIGLCIVERDVHSALLARLQAQSIESQQVIGINNACKTVRRVLNQNDNHVDVGNGNLAVAIHIGTLHRLVTILASLDDFDNHIDVGNADFTIGIDITFQPDALEQEILPLGSLLVQLYRGRRNDQRNLGLHHTSPDAVAQSRHINGLTVQRIQSRHAGHGKTAQTGHRGRQRDR